MTLTFLSCALNVVGNMEVMNYGVNENGNHYWSGMREAQVEDTDSEPENARKVITLRQKQFCIQMVLHLHASC